MSRNRSRRNRNNSASDEAHINIASGNDRVPLQVGRVTGGNRARTRDRRERPQEPETTARSGGSVNICTDGARVGAQLDTVTVSGGIVIHM